MKTEELFSVDTDGSKSRCDRDSANKTVVDIVDKSCTLDDDLQELYGSRNYGLPSSRPTMISAKYRQKEERRKVLKLSMNKLKRIEDPESSLRRSVLINNTVKRLQREAREEKSQKNQITNSYSQNKCFGISNDFIAKQEENLKTDVFATTLTSRTSDQLLDITNLPDGKTCAKYGNDDCLDCDEAISDLTFPVDSSSSGGGSSSSSSSSRSCGSKSRKRSIDETLEEECDVLSQFYLPPTPRIISALDEDEDEDVNVVDIDTPPPAPPAKKKRGADSQDALSCCLTAADRLRDNLPSLLSSTLSSSTTSCSSSSLLSSSSPSMPFDEWCMDESILLQAASSIQTSHPTPSSPFSCGHSSMLNEIVVYHNLIASFES